MYKKNNPTLRTANQPTHNNIENRIIGGAEKPNLYQIRGQGINPKKFSQGLYTQFSSWIGETGAVKGCPVNCQYCFYQLDGMTPVKPRILISPRKLVSQICKINTYDSNIPINFGSQTDIFSTKETIDYYTEVVKIYSQSKYPNPLIFITKRSIPDSFIKLAKSIPQKVLFYISYSGLNNSGLEPTVNEEDQRVNFIKLHKAGLATVHYWRPFFPQNSNDVILNKVLSHVSKYATCSVANGLHLNNGILKNIAPFWPELLKQSYDFKNTGEFWPIGVLNKLQDIVNKRYPNYPVYYTNTPCSISYSLNLPDVQGCRFDGMCNKSNCPKVQRLLCNNQKIPSRLKVDKVLNSVGIDLQNVQFKKNCLIINTNVDPALLIYLRFVLHYPVYCSKTPSDHRYNWASPTGVYTNQIIAIPWTEDFNSN